jgi:hypothetical protein
MSDKLTIEELRGRLNNLYDYSFPHLKEEYKGKHYLVTCVCPKHGVFKSSIANMEAGHGCKKCGIERRTQESSQRIRWPELEKRLIKIHQGKYDYSLVDKEYTNMRDKQKIICPVHGEFEQNLEMHQKQGCPKCGFIRIGDALRLPQQEWIEKARKVHGDKYDYSLADYQSAYKKVKIICPKHGVFEQTASSHTNRKNGCPRCKESKGEKAISEFLISNGIEFVDQKRFSDCRGRVKPLPFDFYLPKQNLCIEFQGYHHYFVYATRRNGLQNFADTKKNDQIKKLYCLSKNIGFLEIKYDEDIIKKLEFLKTQAPSV